MHVEQINGKLWSNHILFRDYLNKNPEINIEYSNLKKCLEKDFFENRNNYAIGKDPFIEKVIETVERENRTILK
ncbi:GrpB family protein [Oceanirhabdus sp. W0125-5]|uniref:GrpB family protein n=1 Tax=Oceanirhabdus sp. W0125-5 TaxID=2999116 RepID=UPI0022F33B25|nr:GrpB family protein [Oceanirhabdus sp. W0125-5]WBW99757.1 GrpB family protein [Oceanirhabdus sp. W0125-5]